MNDATSAEPSPLQAQFDSLSIPVHRASTVLFDNTSAFLARRTQLFDGFTYGLYGTPTTRALENAVAEIEGGSRSILVPSGLAAVTFPTLALLSAGDRVLVADCVYGPTMNHCTKELRRLGLLVDVIDARSDGTDWITGTLPRMVVIESPGSYSMEIQDIGKICEQAHAAGALVLADNTWGFGNTNLFMHGVDIVSTALSKYAGGHSDVCMGSITVRDEELFRRLKSFVSGIGSGVSSDDAYLVHRGLRTLDVRLAEQARRGLVVSAWLRGRPEVAEVLNPADPLDREYCRFQQYFRRGNGLVGFVPRCQDLDRIASMIDGLQHFRIGASWGGTESLVAIADLSQARVSELNHSGSWIVRLHIGLENFDTLMLDLERAMVRLQSSSRKDAGTSAKTGSEGIANPKRTTK